ncbi:LysE family translocator [Jannaschia sp. M317]|uniref:LysE family translocator n=1 Tax=Jannaschia sp. M317 TaxID=2867011 RepID=UPI0021A3FBF7|nr:LysE family translocator [Jannaschia sp. M317]UWQ18686.1 LysE family translocator [Jannaschia sp. M317]
MTDLAPHLPGLLVAWGMLCLGLFSPGPNILAIIGTSMERGRPQGLALAAGVSVGTLLWGVLAVTGFTAVLTLWAGAMTVLKLAGAAYLLWLAYGAFRSAAQTVEVNTRTVDAPNLRAYGLRGLMVQMTNPKAAIFWVAIAAVGTGPDTPVFILVTLIGVSFLISLAGHVVYALAFSTRAAVALYARGRRAAQATIGTFFTYAAYRLATERT